MDLWMRIKLNKPIENPYDITPGSCSIVADGKEYILGFCTYFADFVDDDPTVIDMTCLTLDYYQYSDAAEFEFGFGKTIKNIEYLNSLNIKNNNNECHPIEILNFVLDNIPMEKIPKISSDTIEIRSLGKLDLSNYVRCGLKETALQKYNLFLKQENERKE